MSSAPTAVQEHDALSRALVDDHDLGIPDGSPETSPPPPGSWRRRLLAVLVVAAIVVLLALAFEGPVASEWHNVRQGHLASDLLVGRKRAAEGQALATLQIPKIDVNEVIVEGDGPGELEGGPGHRIGTPLPGAKGNSLVFGHAQGWGSPFARLSELAKNDLVVVKTRLDSPTVFTVVSVSHVRHDDVRRLAPSKDHRLTLVTGDGGYRSDHLMIVSAVSGDASKLGRVPTGLSAYPDQGPFPVPTVLVTLAAFVLARAAFVWFRRQGRGLVGTLVVVAPLVLGGLLGAMLLVDRLALPPLR